jgi:hypothetical protein
LHQFSGFSSGIARTGCENCFLDNKPSLLRMLLQIAAKLFIDDAFDMPLTSEETSLSFG